MNKIMIAAAVAAALASYLVARRRARSTVGHTTASPALPGDKHLTNVFAKAKKYNM